mmetsp:Transcript_19177/g.41328  ORF Transcript_19177/g.41328 Transcript_19177/m.41328 type:complete len:109 (+) Transcript_19177:2-328(+)
MVTAGKILFARPVCEVEHPLVKLQWCRHSREDREGRHVLGDVFRLGRVLLEVLTLTPAERYEHLRGAGPPPWRIFSLCREMRMTSAEFVHTVDQLVEQDCVALQSWLQ